jgi:hypothetical protein
MIHTLFAIDCGATNWRIYRAGYQVDGASVRLAAEPQPSPLTSFVERRLPAMLCLSPDGVGLETFGEAAQQRLEDEAVRERVREHFKPCIGAHLSPAPLPHQKRYTHAQALDYTRMLLAAVLEQLRQEKWRALPSGENIHLAMAYPVHWRSEGQGVIFEEFRKTVEGCLPQELHANLRYVAEPDGAILCLQRQGLLRPSADGHLTLIADIGGSSSDLIAGQLDPRAGTLVAVRRYGQPHGGGLYDDEVAKYIADELHIPASALADDPTAMVALRVYGRQLKESLSRQLLHPDSSLTSVKRVVTLVLREEQVFRGWVSLDESGFRQIARHRIVDFQYVIENGLKGMGLAEADIGQVVLVGGGSKLFTVIGHLRERFGAGNVLLADNPEEIVVQGAALEYEKASELPWQRPAVPPPPPPPTWALVDADGQPFPLREDLITLGRKRDNVIWVRDDRASRHHAEIRTAAGGFQIVDLESSNGTFVNDERLTPGQPRALAEGDQVRIGGTVLTLRGLTPVPDQVTPP